MQTCMNTDFESVLERVLETVRNGISKKLNEKVTEITEASGGLASEEDIRNHRWSRGEQFGGQVFLYLRIGTRRYQLWDSGEGVIFTDSTTSFTQDVPWLTGFPGEMELFRQVSAVVLRDAPDRVKSNVLQGLNQMYQMQM